MCRFSCRQLARTTQNLHSSANLLLNMAPGTMQYGFKSVCVRCKAVPSPAVRSFSRLCASTVTQGHHLHTPMSELEGKYRIQALCAAHTCVHTFSSKNGLCIAVYKPGGLGHAEHPSIGKKCITLCSSIEWSTVQPWKTRLINPDIKTMLML